MKGSERSIASSGINFFDALQIVFIVLKLTNLIDWPWFWVLAPVWIGAIIAAIVLALVFILWIARRRHKK